MAPNGRKLNGTRSLDERDARIIALLIEGRTNRAIASRLKIPMSTIQRRTRRLFEDGLVSTRIQLNYKKLGLRNGLLHVYLKNGNIDEVAHKVLDIRGMHSISVHIGNSDIIGEFVFKEPEELMNIISGVKTIDGVEKVVWSEEVMRLDQKQGDHQKVEIS